MAKESPNSQINHLMANSAKSGIAIIGASGYGGLQAVKLLRDHPSFDIKFLGGERSVGQRWNEINPYLPIEEDLEIQQAVPNDIAAVAEYAILSLPNGLASKLVPELLERKVRVIDLSADYRYRSLTEWKKIYTQGGIHSERNDDKLCGEAIYGLPEWNREKISKARLVASPGCYPTATLTAILPFLNQGLIETEGLIIDAKSGTSGGGRAAKEHLLLSEASESICPYSVIGHRHTSEIEQCATEIAGQKIIVQFTPHLVPMVRGILVTAYARLRDPGITAEDCKIVLESIYKDQPFVEVLPVGIYPSTKWTRYTNKAYLSVQVDQRTGRLVIICSIDNLLKGQAGQAIQSLNIMSHNDEKLGLPAFTYFP